MMIPASEPMATSQNQQLFHRRPRQVQRHSQPGVDLKYRVLWQISAFCAFLRRSSTPLCPLVATTITCGADIPDYCGTELKRAPWVTAQKGENVTSNASGGSTAALVLGIIGGIIGIFAAFIAMFFGGLGAAFGADGGETVIGLGFAAVFIGVAAIVGGALARSKPKAAFWLLLLTGIGGFIAVSAAWLISGPLLLIGALLARSGMKSAPQAA
jgi:hypothetical protein